MAALSHDDFVALLRRTTDSDGWLDPILDDPDGEAAMGACIEIFTRASAAMDYDCNLGLISLAPGGTPGTSSIQISRTTTGTSGTIPVNFPFVDGRGVRVLTTAPVAIGAGVASIALPVQTIRETEGVNTEDDPGFAIDPAAPVVLDGASVTVLIAPPGSAGIVATTFQTVGPSTKITGAMSDYLSLHGSERGQIRQAGEETEAYRTRVRTIPDAVSPIAVSDGVLTVASQLGIIATVLEPFADGATPALKTTHGLGSFFPMFWSSTNTAGTQASAAASPATDFLDDTGDNREVVDRRTATAYFRIELAGLLFDTAQPGGEVFFWDDGYWDDPVAGFPDVGFPPSVSALGNAIWEEANRKKAGGVSFDILLRATTKTYAAGSTTLAAETVVWTMTPAAGHAWIFADMVAGHDGALNAFPPGLLVPPTAYHRLKFTFLDGSTFTTPPFYGRESERLTPDRFSALGAHLQPITLVQGIVLSDTVCIVNLVATLFALDLTLP
jgi:hypothetical protein